jgi:hypothetical protein
MRSLIAPFDSDSAPTSVAFRMSNTSCAARTWAVGFQRPSRIVRSAPNADGMSSSALARIRACAEAFTCGAAAPCL